MSIYHQICFNELSWLTLRHTMWLYLHSTSNHGIMKKPSPLTKHSFQFQEMICTSRGWGGGWTLTAFNPCSYFSGWRLKLKRMLRWRNMLTHFLPFQPLFYQVLRQDQWLLLVSAAGQLTFKSISMRRTLQWWFLRARRDRRARESDLWQAKNKWEVSLRDNKLVNVGLLLRFSGGYL